MPIKPNPFVIRCEKCGWTTRYAPASDALLETPHSACKQCGSLDLSRTPAGVIETALLSMLSLLKQ